VKDQLDIFGNKHTWLMTLLYIITFGTFSGLAAQFGLLMKNFYGTGAIWTLISGVGLIGSQSRYTIPALTPDLSTCGRHLARLTSTSSCGACSRSSCSPASAMLRRSSRCR
jgi:hypothetical protein